MSFWDDLPIKTLCISHNRDVDGIASAALMKSLTNCEIKLIDYGELIETLKSVDGINNLFICDLGLSRDIELPFLEEVKKIRKIAGICYVDHHPMHESLRQRLSEEGVRVIHSTEECTAVINYQLHSQKLPPEAGLLAACAAVTDRIESGKTSKKLLQRFDRDLVLFEAGLLSYAIAGRGDNPGFLNKLTEELSSFKAPHQIEHLCEDASDYAQKMLDLIRRIPQEGKKLQNCAYIETSERSLGSVANFLIGEFDVPVGIAYKYKPETSECVVSLRSMDGVAVNLGQITSKVSSIFDGNGGGHANASGAIVPKDKIRDFLIRLDSELVIKTETR